MKQKYLKIETQLENNDPPYYVVYKSFATALNSISNVSVIEKHVDYEKQIAHYIIINCFNEQIDIEVIPVDYFKS